MKKILYFLFLFFALTIFDIFKVNASDEAQYFVVTAYYSPLANQEKYSYSVYLNRERTFEEEKRLQGEGIAGASGKGVFIGMLAAPKKYSFGTKIYLNGLGVGEVADRGGAIVKAGKRGYKNDRLDVWMGYGEEGLKRATLWGKRTIKGSIVNKKTAVDLDYSKGFGSKINFNKSKYVKKIEEEINIFNKNINSIFEIKKLQEILKKMNFYEGKINGNKKDIISPVFDFQIKNKIVKSEYSPGAGTYGPKTRKTLKIKYNKFLIQKEKKVLELAKIAEEKKKEEKRKKTLVIKAEKLRLLSENKANKTLSFIGTPKFGEISHSVRELQVRLKQLGYFNNKDTAIYGNITKKAIINYQLDKKIIKYKDQKGAGTIGEKTKEFLKKDIARKYLIEIVKKENTIIKI